MTGTASPTSLRFDAPVRKQSEDVCNAPGVRITRRGRAVLLVVLVALLLAAFTLGRTGDSQAATDGATRAPYATTTVHEGESLWAVAQRVAPQHDPRAVVQQIRELNNLPSASVQVGQQLLLPRTA